MKEDRLLITSIQRFSLHDGPGIRTTVFLKGCNLHCPWCCNPENIDPRIQRYEKNGKEGIFGCYITTEELLAELLKDKDFYGEYTGEYNGLDELPGGVTFSGGEPLLQMELLAPICERLHEKKVHIAVETALFVPTKLVEIAYDHIDLFYVDIKILDAMLAKKIEGGELDQYLSNMDWLMSREQMKPIVMRIPVIKGYTDDVKNQGKVIELIKKNIARIDKVEVLQGHNLSKLKYQALRTEKPKGLEPSSEIINAYNDEISRLFSV